MRVQGIYTFWLEAVAKPKPNSPSLSPNHFGNPQPTTNTKVCTHGRNAMQRNAMERNAMHCMVCLHGWTDVYMYVCLYVCMHVCMHAYMYVCKYLGMYACMHVLSQTLSPPPPAEGRQDVCEQCPGPCKLAGQ